MQNIARQIDFDKESSRAIKLNSALSKSQMGSLSDWSRQGCCFGPASPSSYCSAADEGMPSAKQYLASSSSRLVVEHEAFLRNSAVSPSCLAVAAWRSPVVAAAGNCWSFLVAQRVSDFGVASSSSSRSLVASSSLAAAGSAVAGLETCPGSAASFLLADIGGAFLRRASNHLLAAPVLLAVDLASSLADIGQAFLHHQESFHLAVVEWASSPLVVVAESLRLGVVVAAAAASSVDGASFHLVASSLRVVVAEWLLLAVD
jgi:hypothetical protein